MERTRSAILTALVVVFCTSFTDGAITSWALDGGTAVTAASNDFTTPVSQAETNDTTVTLFTVTAVAGNSLSSYTIILPTGGKFTVGTAGTADAGKVKLASGQELDRETDSQIIVKIEAVDDASGTLTTGTATVTIAITDVNEFTPSFSSPSSVAVTVDNQTPANTLVFTAAATDSDAVDNTITYTIVSGNTNTDFALGSSTGKITTANVLNSATTSSYALVIRAADSAATAKSATSTVNVNVCANLVCSSGAGSASVSLITVALMVIASVFRLA